MRFEVQPVKLTFQAVLTREANGKIGWGVLEVGGNAARETTQTIELTLRPVWQLPDGTVMEKFTISDTETRTEADQLEDQP